MTTAGAYAMQSAYFFKSVAIVANGANGKSDIEGKAAREAVSECGQRASFNLGESCLQIFDNLRGDDVGIGDVGVVFKD